ncbi:DUF551 domain-containing protein [Klebsiella pneumoniae]|uniref:DUF551 domain-containing protein n=1 Tax=Klebsiella pneumoniae TaxID=573 RepID=UPI000DE6711C|nr:DUF551 domain-containing protein [Klebsiella pneumoniae]WLX00830.1 DUF551 domain-containing protein [Klebsiella pneumoniae]SSG39360.1 Protein of uncharacterised function (DUF551) [Klebsiella pneumoniae]
MTKSTITRERVVALIAEHSYDSALVDALEHLLAAMGAEPVAWIAQNKNTGEIEIDEPFAKATNPKYWTDAFPVYRHAQPAPVVPEKCPAEIRDLISSHTDALFNDDDAQEIWNACRAAMLQAGSDEIGSWGNDKYPPSDKPNPIDHGYRPDCECTGCKATARICAELAGWIPVSERMPEDDDFVYIWPRPDFGVELHIGQYCERSHKGGGWYAQVYEQNYGIEWHPITVTHWMPLPAAPQEVK